VISNVRPAAVSRLGQSEGVVLSDVDWQGQYSARDLRGLVEFACLLPSHVRLGELCGFCGERPCVLRWQAGSSRP
jgi:hypothetical protein